MNIYRKLVWVLSYYQVNKTMHKVFICFISGLMFAQMTQSASAMDMSGKHSLAKRSQNPLSSMVIVPYDSDFNFNSGPFNRTQYVGTLKPIIPIHLEKVRLINRMNIILKNQPVGRSDEKFGIGDFRYQLFVSPKKHGNYMWGIGPSFTFPTASDDVLGSGKYSAGPTAMIMTMPGNWVLGTRFDQQWSYAGDNDRDDVNKMEIQYLINYNLSDGWALRSTPTIHANWEATSSNVWTIPFGGGVQKLFKVNQQVFTASLQGFYNVTRPDDADEWTIQFTFTALFPE
jgi:hypothetical protein